MCRVDEELQQNLFYNLQAKLSVIAAVNTVKINWETTN